MAGGETRRSRKKALAEAILASDGGDLTAALEMADGMSISDVTELMYEGKPDLQFDHSELCDRFITEWLPRLSPTERLAAVIRLDGLYSLGLVWLPHAEDRELERQLRLGSAAITDFENTFVGAAQLACSPDTSFDSKFAEKLIRMGKGPLAEVARSLDELADELDELQKAEDAREANEE